MRTLRLSLVGTFVLALLGGLGGAVVAQSDEDTDQVTAQMLDDMAREAWNTDDVALLEEAYASDAVHRAVYFDGIDVFAGRDAIIDAAMGSLTVTALAPVVELEAPDGELHWAEFADAVSPSFSGEGTVCSFWALDGQIVRQDCLLPMDCPAGVCTP